MNDKLSKDMEEMALEEGESQRERDERERSRGITLDEMSLDLNADEVNRKIKKACDETSTGALKEEIRHKLAADGDSFSWDGKKVSEMDPAELKKLVDILDRSGLKMR